MVHHGSGNASIQALRGGAPQFGSTDPGDLLGLNPAKLKS